MRAIRTLFVAVAVAVPSNAAAQVSLRSVSVGVAHEVPSPDVTISGVRETFHVTGVKFAVTVYERNDLRFGVEGGWHTGVKHFGFLSMFDTGGLTTRATIRDIPVVAVFKWPGECHQGFCVSLVGGAGLDFEYRSSETTFCDRLSCDQQAPLTKIRNLPTITGGIDFGTRLSPTLEVHSDLRVWWVSRDRDNGKGRSALYANSLIPRSAWLELGVGLVWRFRQH